MQIQFGGNGNTVSGAVSVAGAGITTAINAEVYDTQFSGSAGGVDCENG